MVEDYNDDAVAENAEDYNDDAVAENAEDYNDDAATENAEGTLPGIVNRIREEYEMRIAEMETKYAAAIADRDSIIQQLISGNPSGTVPRETFVDKINNKRTFKKW